MNQPRHDPRLTFLNGLVQQLHHLPCSEVDVSLPAMFDKPKGEQGNVADLYPRTTIPECKKHSKWSAYYGLLLALPHYWKLPDLPWLIGEAQVPQQKHHFI